LALAEKLKIKNPDPQFAKINFVFNFFLLPIFVQLDELKKGNSIKIKNEKFAEILHPILFSLAQENNFWKFKTKKIDENLVEIFLKK